jgi:hypothetical protein
MHAAATVHACAVKIVTYRDNYKQNRGFLTFDCSQKKGFLTFDCFTEKTSHLSGYR